MAYLGSTQLSSVSNPPLRVGGGMGAGADVRITGGTTMYVSGVGKGLNFGQQGWVYHTTDITSAPLASGYFTDAKTRGVLDGIEYPGNVVIPGATGTRGLAKGPRVFARVLFGDADGRRKIPSTTL